MTTIKNIVRTNGALSSWTEDGEEFTVTLNASNKPASIQSKRGRWVQQACTINYDSAGKFIGLTGDLKTLMLNDLIADANGGVKAVTDSSGNVTGLAGPGGVEVDYLAAIGGRVTSITYSPSGQVATYSSGGVSYTVSYDASGRVQSVTDGTAVRTVAYNANGTVASII